MSCSGADVELVPGPWGDKNEEHLVLVVNPKPCEVAIGFGDAVGALVPCRAEEGSGDEVLKKSIEERGNLPQSEAELSEYAAGKASCVNVNRVKCSRLVEQSSECYLGAEGDVFSGGDEVVLAGGSEAERLVVAEGAGDQVLVADAEGSARSVPCH